MGKWTDRGNAYSGQKKEDSLFSVFNWKELEPTQPEENTKEEELSTDKEPPKVEEEPTSENPQKEETKNEAESEKPIEPSKENEPSGGDTSEESEKDKDKKVQSKLVDEAEASEENTSENSSIENEENEDEGEDDGSNLVDEAEEEPPKTESLKEMDLKDVLKINSMNIDFGELFPGQILEETVIILNNLAATKVPFKIKINCLSKEFDDLDEYVYSMRRPTTQDVFNYNDTFLILLAQKAISYYKLAIKVPNIMEEKQILGNIEISCTECQNGTITIPIKSTIGKKHFLKTRGNLISWIETG